MTDWDDEELFAELQHAIRARRDVPPEFVEAAKSAFAWRNIDAELAQLTYDSTDSARRSDLAAATRSEPASIRALTFTSAAMTIELEVTEDSVLGQVVPGPARHDRAPAPGWPGARHRRRRDRLLFDPAHPARAVPAALPGRGRHRRAHQLDHALNQAAPSATSDSAVACRIGSAAGRLRTL